MEKEKISSTERALTLSNFSPRSSEKKIKKIKNEIDTDYIDRNLPDPLLYQRHRELLNARRTEVVAVANGIGREVKIVDLGPDFPMMAKGLELAYKVKKKIGSDDKTAPSISLSVLLQQVTKLEVNQNNEPS